jgi:hypothetical protein
VERAKKEENNNNKNNPHTHIHSGLLARMHTFGVGGASTKKKSGMGRSGFPEAKKHTPNTKQLSNPITLQRG